MSITGKELLEHVDSDFDMKVLQVVASREGGFTMLQVTRQLKASYTRVKYAFYNLRMRHMIEASPKGYRRLSVTPKGLAELSIKGM